ncbi:MAG: sensor histidine kinase [Chromatiales bacterium]|nr:sensor histidine kinase [Chromatiales bacterium]
MRSLRLRLLVASTVSIVAALAVAGLGLIALFEREVERRVDAELETHLRQLVGSLELAGPDGPRLGNPLADPRFELPYSGLYWQIEDEVGSWRLRSRSLWDHVLSLPPDALVPGVPHHHRLPGPAGTTLRVRERQVVFRAAGASPTVRVAVAIDRAELTTARAAFAEAMIPALVLLAVALSAAAWAQVVVGLRPLAVVRRRVEAVRAARRERLGGGFPDEVQPLATELDALLDERDRSIERARARAADLAHGLRTPLTVLVNDVGRLRARGEVEIADELESLAQGMRRHVDHELARSRLAADVVELAEPTALAPVVDGVVATLRRSPRGSALTWEVSVDPSIRARVGRDDLFEVVGNLLDNACKWALARVVVEVRRDGDAVLLRIGDDGPGVAEPDLGRLGQRGARLDEAVPGTGLGLALVAEVLTAYGASLTLGRAGEGGLEVRVRLPV